MLDRKFFMELAKKVVPRFRKHIFMDALDVKGKKFKGYSNLYGQAKRSGVLFRQASEFKNSTAPVLTSDLLTDFKLVGTSASGFTFGFPTQGGKVNNLARMGRIISSESTPVPKKLGKFIISEADRYVEKWWKKNAPKGGTINI